MDLDLRLVRYFVTVAEELHFGRAAARLYISQPALSKQIRKLEQQVGGTLLERDSRHVDLTVRGHRFLEEARTLLALASSMQNDEETDVVRIAHVFELATSRIVADEFARTHPDARLVERALDSNGQLDALLRGQLDVAILRVTAQMLAEHPVGWHHRPLRLEPFSLVGRPGEAPRATASLYERPVHVFGDPPGSGSYNAHGEYLSAFERHSGLHLGWLGTPGAFSHCLAALNRTAVPAFVLEFDSYASRYAAEGFPVHAPAELRPCYPWSLAWRHAEPDGATAALLGVASRVGAQQGWLDAGLVHDPPLWLPADDPVREAVDVPAG